MGTTLPATGRRRDYSETDAVCRELAVRWGRQPSTVRQMLHGRHRLDRLTADVIETMRRHHADDRLARWTAPLRAALAGIGADPLTRQLLRDAQCADLAEDAAENEYRLAETPEAARRWVQRIDELVGWLMKLRRSLVERHNLNGEA